MGKYIIELEREEIAYKTVNSNGTPMIQLLALAPHTEPDLDAIRKEAYQQGYDNAKHSIIDNLEESTAEAYRRGYEEGMQLSIDDAKLKEEYRRGLNDAWECVDRIFDMPCKLREQIFSKCNTVGVWDILRCYFASEAIEKIRQYEQEKDKQARIEYNCEEIKDVLNITMKECNVSLDDIAEVLRKMKEAE